jgi:RNA polymerase sigma-70 factor (ECF subfamily)
LYSENSFRRLTHAIRATSDALFGVALRMLRRRDWAEEVLQESFVSIWRHSGRYDRNKGAAMTWMIRIVRNQALDWIAPSRPDGFERRWSGDDGDVDDADFGAASALGPRLAEDTPLAARLLVCLERLDAPQRQSIALVFFHGMSHVDLSAHLREPLGTVKAWVRRGLKRLRLCLASTD